MFAVPASVPSDVLDISFVMSNWHLRISTFKLKSWPSQTQWLTSSLSGHMIPRVNKFLKINIDVTTFDSPFSPIPHFKSSVSTVNSTLKLYSKQAYLVQYKSDYVIFYTQSAMLTATSNIFTMILYNPVSGDFSNPGASVFPSLFCSSTLAFSLHSDIPSNFCVRAGTLFFLFSHHSLLKFI